MSARGFRGENDLSVTLCVTAPLGGEPRERRLDFCREVLSVRGFRGEDDLSVTLCVTAPLGGSRMGLPSGSVKKGKNGFIPPGFRGMY